MTKLDILFKDLEKNAYDKSSHKYYFKEANQIIKKHFDSLGEFLEVEKKESFDWDKLLTFINQKTGRNFQVINKVVRRKYIARLKDGYTKKMIMTAIENAPQTEHHKNNGCQHLTPEFFSRADKIDMYATPVSKNDSEKIKLNLNLG